MIDVQAFTFKAKADMSDLDGRDKSMPKVIKRSRLVRSRVRRGHICGGPGGFEAVQEMLDG